MLSLIIVSVVIVSVIVITILFVIGVLYYREKNSKEYLLSSRMITRTNTELPNNLSPTIIPQIPIISSSPSIGRSADLIKSWEVKFDEITFEEELGRGAYGVVFLANWRLQKVAAKKLLEDSLSENGEDFAKEAELLMALRPHKNIVQFLGVILRPLCIITEYLPRGSLFQLLESEHPMDYVLLLKFANDIVAGMVHLHSEGVIHRDLACRNLLLDESGTVKITDFGLSRTLTAGSRKTKMYVGPIRWMSPEALSDGYYSTKSDVYSFASVLYELLTREEPWLGMLPQNVMSAVLGNQRPKIPDFTPKNMIELMQKCWSEDPVKRPEFLTIHDILNENLLKK